MSGPRTRSQDHMEDNTSAPNIGSTMRQTVNSTPSTMTPPSRRNPIPNTPSRDQEMDELKKMVYSLTNQLNTVLSQRSNSSSRSIEEKLIKCLPKTKAPVYKGDTLKLDEFFHSIERYYTLRGIDIKVPDHDTWLGEAIREHLEGPALKYYSDTNDSKIVKPSWSQVKIQLKERFAVEDQASKDRQNLIKIRQGSSSLETYINKFLELNTRASRECELPEKWQIELFTMGLESTDVTAHVKLKHDVKLTKVIQSAREADAVYTMRKLTPKGDKQPQQPKKDKNGKKDKTQKNEVAETTNKAKCPKHPHAKHGPEDCWVLHPEKKPSVDSGNKNQNNAAQEGKKKNPSEQNMKELCERLNSISESLSKSLNYQA